MKDCYSMETGCPHHGGIQYPPANCNGACPHHGEVVITTSSTFTP